MEHKVEIDWKEKTAHDPKKKELYFFRSQYEDGCIKAFYSHSPWLRTGNMQKGWVIIDPKRSVVISRVETRSMGSPTGEGRKWFREQRKLHGKTIKVFRDDFGDLLYTMGD